jgi:hypothetical protein
VKRMRFLERLYLGLKQAHHFFKGRLTIYETGFVLPNASTLFRPQAGMNHQPEEALCAGYHGALSNRPMPTSLLLRFQNFAIVWWKK